MYRLLPGLIHVQTKNFSFKDLQERCDQFLNFLRRKGLNQQDVIFSQMPLLPENWLTVLVSIKGGYRLVPAATMLSVQDIVYRFSKLMPAAVIADPESAAKIDEAEVLAGKSVALKIVVNGLKDGWIPFDQIREEQTTADAADTHADEPLFLFFTSGTTGMPKVVAHTHLSYPAWAFDHSCMDRSYNREIYIIIFPSRVGRNSPGAVSSRHGVLAPLFLLFIKPVVLMRLNICACLKNIR